MATTGKLTRRSLLTLTAGGCFAGADIRAALAQAAMQGKPLLTAQSLTALMRSPQRLAAYAELAREPGGDLVAFLSRRFALTERQIAEIKTIAPAQVADLKSKAGLAAQQAAEAVGKEAKDRAGGCKAAARRGTRIHLQTRFANGTLTVVMNDVPVKPATASGSKGAPGAAPQTTNRGLVSPGLPETGPGLGASGPAATGTPIAPTAPARGGQMIR